MHQDIVGLSLLPRLQGGHDGTLLGVAQAPGGWLQATAANSYGILPFYPLPVLL